ncbi:peroxidase family protein [Paenarthrobacter ureafaciens]|uniref:peroxidase family protein n=1 Tax=Paenarthrobacter ureafaciens TaxID=37931 RepID=UPI001409237A|nr:peroxidase family protein [Paenarthrobacter ureafaciens]MCX8453700.1 heme peroxidase [Paenarthrobacter ureafaciens]MCY0973359.1 heme peroxidase [Paenarthrobacter ureafaciens]
MAKTHRKPPVDSSRFVGGGKLWAAAATGALALVAALGLHPVPASALQAPSGSGFTVTPADLSFILKQIKIAEAHVANTTSATGACGALIGTGPDQIASPLLSQGLRTVDGSCNNLQPGQEAYGASDRVFPRLVRPSFVPAETGSLGGAVKETSYAQKTGSVFDTRPRMISNLIADQTSTNPAAVTAAGFPARSQDKTGVVPCTTDPVPEATPPVAGSPEGCVPSHSTLDIPNVSTDVGLSPPYNSLFTLFGQFFDHGIDQTVKGGGAVYVPLSPGDPLIAGDDRAFGTADDLNPRMRFMVLTRGQNQPGPDGVAGTTDDIQDALNTNSPWVDQSQTYASHSSHHVFLREYVNNSDGHPVPSGRLLGGSLGSPGAGGMATWADTKKQARELLGIQLMDKDVLNVPMLAADPYGRFIPGPNRGLPQFVTASGLIEADRSANNGNGTLVPQDVLYFNTPFLTDIAHNADPSAQDSDHNPATAPIAPQPDTDTIASADFAGQTAGTYDDEMLNAHFIAGDGRVNENIGLTAIHQVFHSEHDRLVADIKRVLSDDRSPRGVAALTEWKAASGADGWNGERLFQAARFITEMEYQHLVFEEFVRKMQPAVNVFEPFAFSQTDIDPAITAEFAHSVYRFGHSMLTETISRRNEDGPGPDGVWGNRDDVSGAHNDLPLLKGFLNPPAYTDGGAAGQLTAEQAAGSIIMGMSDQVGAELDEFVTDTLRNRLLGLPLDLAAINIARGRSEGIPALNILRRQLHDATNDGQLKPYKNWIDFGENIKHPASLVNFIAAYGTHPSIVSATTPEAKRKAARLLVSPDPLTGEAAPADAAAFMNSTETWASVGTSSVTGLDEVDLWIGGLAERTNLFGGLLGSTFNYVFESQMTDLQNGDRLYYLARTPGTNLLAQLEGNTFAELLMRNTNAKALKADAFATADCRFELKNLEGSTNGFASFGNSVSDDPGTECNENDLLLRMPDGTIKYRASNAVDPDGLNGQAVYNGTPGTDRIHGGLDNDTFWGGEGNDIVEGGDGADTVLGGEGSDVITDLAGNDVLNGGPGNDALDGGPGLDLLLGGDGKDFINGGANSNESFSGEGDDFIIAGEGLDSVFGGGGDDWAEGGDSPDLLIGDSSNLFFLDDSQKPGHDVLTGQGGDDDYDMEGGDDVGLAGPGIEKVAGASGFDWETGAYDPQPQDADLNLPIAPLDILQVGVRDRYNEVEALSGGPFADTLRGDDLIPRQVGGGGFIGCDVLDQAGIDRIRGLDQLVTSLPTPTAEVINASAAKECPVLTGDRVWGEGNILLGGGGSDLIEGRGGNDIIDGDRFLNVRLSIRTDPTDPGTETGSAPSMTAQYQRAADGTPTGPTLQQAVFAGKIDPHNIVIVREILISTDGIDTAVFSDVETNYTITTTGGDGTLGSAGSITTVQHHGARDGTDTLRNIERLSFANVPDAGGKTPDDDTGTPGGGEDETPEAAEEDGIGGIIPGNGEVAVILDPSPTPVPTPTVQLPAVPGSAEPVPAQPPVEAGSIAVRTVDPAGAQVGPLIMADPGTTRVVVNGLENGVAYRFQAAPVLGNTAPSFKGLSQPIVPGTDSDHRTREGDTMGDTGPARQAADPGALPPPAEVSSPPVILARLGQYLATDEGTAVAAVAVCSLLAMGSLFTYRLRARRAGSRQHRRR